MGAPADKKGKLIDLILTSKIFAELDRVDCEELLKVVEEVTLNQGDILFKLGDPSDCLYILTHGQLTAVQHTVDNKDKIIGTIDIGETVGELGVLSNQPRSLTIRATVDSKLLKFPRQAFQEFCKNKHSMILRIIDLIIYRSQNTLKIISQKKLYQHIAIIAGNDKAPMDTVIQYLKKCFDNNEKYVFVEKISPDISLKELMFDAEHNNKILIFILDETNVRSLSINTFHIGSIYVIVNADTLTPFSEFTMAMLNQHKTPAKTKYELVLMHDDNIVIPKGTKEWLKQGEFTLHHHLRMNDSLDYQRLARFMTGKAIGLVLGGGGQKGWVAIGALKALLDANVPIDAVGGASVGAGIGAYYAKYLTYKGAYEAYYEFSYSLSKGLGIRSLTWPIISLITARGPTAALQHAYGDTEIEDLWLPYFSISCNLNTRKETIHRSGLLWERIRATGAIPGIAPPMVLDGDLHYDGGLVNNLPVDYMHFLLGPDSTIIALSLSGVGDSKKSYRFPPVIPFWMGVIKKLNLGYKEYLFPPFFNTFITALLAGSSSRENTNQLMANVLIRPDLSQFKFLQLGGKDIDTMIEIGYKETQEKIRSYKFSF